MALLRLPRARRLAAIAALFVLAARMALAQPQLEEQVKAVFLFNFTKYVAWPAAALEAPAIRICVVAPPQFLQTVKNAVAGETVDGRPLAAESPAAPEDARGCHILYVSQADRNRMQAWLAAVRGTPVLTVVDDAAMTNDVVIALVRDQNRVRFDVNRQVAGQQGISVSAKLLRVARRVKDR
jgi:hypothetical protein